MTDPPFSKNPPHRFRLSYLPVISKGTGSYSIGVDNVYNFSCTDSSVPWAPTRYSNEPPGPRWCSTVYTHFIRPLSFSYPKSDPNVTPQHAPDKTSLPKTPQTRHHSSKRPRQNITP
uniref:Uncharacterized protein n=1 Tax=Meloidogyne enterolobii TaxID=390850 RepID=A0A6V7YCJ9_MELEN|nr:unnamed protein product [Meloidogyne enterolobii]